ncbi:MAG: spermidine synthase, partial [Parafannyhessea sp.]|uniref:spermidine synthase n=1 Tax=Parafannyhessea sp. TaxID=2847324 RepID=UPI003F067BF6
KAKEKNMTPRPQDALVAWLAAMAERLAGDRKVVASERTMFGRARVVDMHDSDGTPVRVLEVSGTWQSATYLDEGWSELVFPYHRLFADAILELGIASPHALMLGGGGYAFPKYLVTHDDDATVDVVEVDPAVSDLARRHFLLDRLGPAASRMRTYNVDARAFLESSQGRASYDVIANDCFGAQVPTAGIATAEGVRAVASRLAPGGAYLSNVVSALEGRRSRALRDVCATLATAFDHVWVIPCSPEDPDLEDNNVVVASNAGALPIPTWEPSGRPLGRVLRDGAR